MKKTQMIFLTFTITTLGVTMLPGCSKSVAWACESGKEFSVDENKQEETIRRKEVAEQYAIYEPYGMTYDEKTDRFFYEGNMVRYFKDKVKEGCLNSFFFEDGVIDVEPVRDTKERLTGLKRSSDRDFEARTQKEKELREETERLNGLKEGTSFEAGDSDTLDDSLEEYTNLGVTYDAASDTWMYGGKRIYILYDKGYNTYCNASAQEGVCLKVVRKNNNMEKLVEVSSQELERFVR